MDLRVVVLGFSKGNRINSVCVCVCVCVERERECGRWGERVLLEKEKEIDFF